MEKQQDNEYPKYGVDLIDLETRDWEVKHREPYDQLTKGNLNFFDEPDPFFSSDYTITLDWRT